MDYEGSMIYDEYPDKYQLERLAVTVADIMHREEEASQEEQTKTPEEMIHMMQVLICNEIFKRRHNGKRDLYYF